MESDTRIVSSSLLEQPIFTDTSPTVVLPGLIHPAMPPLRSVNSGSSTNTLITLIGVGPALTIATWPDRSTTLSVSPVDEETLALPCHEIRPGKRSTATVDSSACRSRWDCH